MRNFFLKTALATISCGFTVLVFINTYEVVFNKDVAFARSVEKSSAQVVINDSLKNFSTKTGANHGDFNSSLTHLQAIEIPALKIRLQLEEARNINNSWYLRPSFGNYISLNKDSRGTTVDYLVYARESWRTIPEADQIENGMQAVLIYDKGAQSVFKVSEKKALQGTQSLIVSKTEQRQILLIIENGGTNSYYGFSLVGEQ